MSDFKAKMHQIVCRLGLHPRLRSPQTLLGELTALPRPPSWILGAYFEGEGKGREMKGGEGRVEKDRKGKGGGEGRGWWMGRERARAGSPPKLMLGPQNCFPGAGAVESAYWTSY